MRPIIYGIPNCDSIRMAKKWFTTNNIEYHFIDVRTSILDEIRVENWLEALGDRVLINRRSATWKKLSRVEKLVTDKNDLILLLQTNPTLIKRPLLEFCDVIKVGFSPTDYTALFGT